jgi:DnaK suppressor protein
MNPTLLAPYRRLLEEQLAGLEAAHRSHEDQLEEGRTTGDFTGPDRAADLETLEVDAAVAFSEQRLAEKIRHALDRIERGVYGLCESCGEAIAPARLEAKPSVSLCLRCQERHEAAS